MCLKAWETVSDAEMNSQHHEQKWCARKKQFIHQIQYPFSCDNGLACLSRQAYTLGWGTSALIMNKYTESNWWSLFLLEWQLTVICFGTEFPWERLCPCLLTAVCFAVCFASCLWVICGKTQAVLSLCPHCLSSLGPQPGALSLPDWCLHC